MRAAGVHARPAPCWCGHTPRGQQGWGRGGAKQPQDGAVPRCPRSLWRGAAAHAAWQQREQLAGKITTKSPSPQNKKCTRCWLPAACPGGARGVAGLPRAQRHKAHEHPETPGHGKDPPAGWALPTPWDGPGKTAAQREATSGKTGLAAHRGWGKKAPGSPKRLGDVKAEKQAQRQRVGPRSLRGERERPLKGQERDWIHEAAENRPGSLIQDVGPSSYPALSKLCSVKKKVNC